MITITHPPRRPAKESGKKLISLETFKKKYLEKTTYKYEWKQGLVERKEYMKANERYIIDNIVRKHIQTEDFQQGNSIMGEADCYFRALEAYRRPNAAYLTREQIKRPDAAPDAPALVIEVSSPSNSDLTNKQKILEYFEAGVQMIWYIYPPIKQVWIHTSPTSVIICQENDTCQADPVVPGFHISVQDIFAS